MKVYLMNYEKELGSRSRGEKKIFKKPKETKRCKRLLVVEIVDNFFKKV